jgi:hypothetical protein
VVGTDKYRWVVVEVPELLPSHPIAGGGLPPRPQPK